MSKKVSAALAGIVVAGSLGLSAPAASAYPIDCAILLCLAGGWPASAECSAARAEFIRRITPWPIEPPLQIWRCPMRPISFRPDPADPMTRLWEIRDASLQDAARPMPAVLTYLEAERPDPEALLQLVQSYDGENGSADMDISGSEYDFVRSVRVFSVEYARQHVAGRDSECRRTERVRLGTYGDQGEFSWRRSSVSALPPAFTGISGWGRSCPNITARAVYVEWRDYEGNYGFEQVDY